MIFAENAPRYWAAGLPVLPLEPRGKAVKLPSWTTYCSIMPSAELQKSWLERFSDGNIGLPLGPQSGLVAIDVDTDEPKVHALLAKLLPASPWKRKGRKGFVYIYKYSGERTFRIRDTDGSTILECLSLGAQIVLPPSIHPDTGQAYQADRELIDVAKSAPPLPDKVELLLRNGLIESGYQLSTQGFTKITAWVPAGSRDNAMIAHAGILSRAVVKGERTLKEALDEIAQWVDDFTEKVAGDPLDPAKAQQRLIEYFVRDCTGPKRKPVVPGWEKDLDPKVQAQIRQQLGEDGEAWDYHRFVSFATTQFEVHELDSPGYIQFLNTIVSKMVHCSSMTPLEEQMLIRYMVNCSQRRLTAAALLRQLNDLRRGEMEGLDHTEIAQALISEMERFGELRYQNSRWWRWNGAHWLGIDEAVLMRTVAESFGQYPAARRHSDHRGIVSTAASLVAKDICIRPVEGINFANGFLTADLQMVEHHPDFGKTYVLPYRYLPELAGAQPRFMQFLRDSWGEDPDCEEKIQAFREAIAVTLFGIASHFQRAFCLKGVPGAGKTVAMNILQGLLPEGSWCAVAPQNWEDKFAPAQMFAKLMNYAGELSEDRLIPGDIFKMIVEGAEIEAQYKHKPLFRFRPLCAQWFASNHLPKTRDSSAGFSRRWLYLEFTRRVEGQHKNIHLAAEILAEEREAIAAWAVSVLPDLMRRQEYTIPPSSLRLTEEMANGNNSVRFFMTSGKVRVGEGKTTEMTLYDAYWAFCTSTANAKPVSLKNFSQRMEELGGELGFKRVLDQGQFGLEPAYENVKVG